VQTSASPSSYPSDERTALLNSMVESIKVQHTTSLDITPAVLTPDDKEVSPSTRRNRDLAQVLFGDDDTKEEHTTSTKEPAQSTADLEPSVIPDITSSLPTISSSPPPLVDESSSATPPTSPSPYLLTRNPSIPRIPQKPKEEADLTRETREVQQKADAATIALKKDPSKVNLMETLKRTPSARKRIDPSQISGPRLVSASTSVDTIPLRTPSISSNTASGASKLGSRLKRLRGSLRAKNVSSGNEPVVQDSKSPPTSQAAYNEPAKSNVSGDSTMTSAPKTGRFKVPVPTPPASAGPGLKGFMARFRNRQRMSEAPSQRSVPRASSPLSQVSPILPTALRQTDTPLAKSNASIISERSLNSATPRPTGQARPMYSRFPPANPVSATSPPTSAPSSSPSQTLNDSQSAAALEQLYAAANDLGVDQDALQDLLARSGSTSSRNLLARNKTIQAPSQQPGTTEPSERTITTQQIGYVASTSSDQTATPTGYGPQSSDQRSNYIVSDNERVASSEDLVPRKSSIRKPDHLRRPKEGQTDINPVVRRTIIFASDSGLSATEFAAMIQRKNSSRRRRISANSISNRSVHDRVPTPPPPKTPGARRFSADGMPPMPQLPTSLGQAMNANTLSTSTGGPIEKSNSTHDSL
jgi:serine/arginine repetitive matrix protein 2